MTNENKVIAFLAGNAGSFCDDCISKGANVFPRQSVNMICNGLAAKGLISRSIGPCNGRDGTKKVNHLLDTLSLEPPAKTYSPAQKTTIALNRPWFWEGNVQAKLIYWLGNEGYKILSAADTAARSQGVDIVAEDKAGRKLWITVKGYPDSKRHTQARHYFSSAIFDLILYRGKPSSDLLAIGLPAGFSTYENLVQKVAWMREKLFPFDIYWVTDLGGIIRK